VAPSLRSSATRDAGPGGDAVESDQRRSIDGKVEHKGTTGSLSPMEVAVVRGMRNWRARD
jgi:hypothetical protein